MDLTPDTAHSSILLDAVVAAGQAERARVGSDPESVYAVTQAKADELGISLPGDDFCLHGHYGNFHCVICEDLFS